MPLSGELADDLLPPGFVRCQKGSRVRKVSCRQGWLLPWLAWNSANIICLDSCFVLQHLVAGWLPLRSDPLKRSETLFADVEVSGIVTTTSKHANPTDVLGDVLGMDIAGT